MYNTIQAAIESACPGSVIKVSPGNYSESLIIKTGDIVIEPRYDDSQVTVISY